MKNKLLVLFLTVAWLLGAGVAEAGGVLPLVGSEGGGEEGPSKLEWVLAQTIGFIILFVLLWKFAFPIFGRLLRRRSEGIRNTLERVERELQKSRQRKGELEERMRHMDQEAERIAAKASGEAQRLVDGIEEELKQQQDRIEGKTQTELQRERDITRAEVQQAVIELSMQAARYVMETTIEADRQKRLVDRFLEDLEHVELEWLARQ